MPSPGTVRFINALSRLLGWIYFTSWSLSFYPQPLLNLRRHSTTGVLLDFPSINVLGFLFYSLSTTVLYFSPVIRSEYAARNPLSPEPTVRANDVAFALHALLLSVVTLSMFSERIWGLRQDRNRRVKGVTKGIAGGTVVGCLFVGGWVGWEKGRGGGFVGGERGGGSGGGWGWIDLIYAFGYAKLLISIVKYVPQMWVNYRRKSTIGWSIGQILCDFIGGVLSVAQLLLDSSLQNDWSGVTGNPAKFFLGNISILFDVIFMLQHYVLYGSKEGAEAERRGLLGEERRDD